MAFYEFPDNVEARQQVPCKPKGCCTCVRFREYDLELGVVITSAECIVKGTVVARQEPAAQKVKVESGKRKVGVHDARQRLLPELGHLLSALPRQLETPTPKERLAILGSRENDGHDRKGRSGRRVLVFGGAPAGRGRSCGGLRRPEPLLRRRESRLGRLPLPEQRLLGRFGLEALLGQGGLGSRSAAGPCGRLRGLELSLQLPQPGLGGLELRLGLGVRRLGFRVCHLRLRALAAGVALRELHRLSEKRHLAGSGWRIARGKLLHEHVQVELGEVAGIEEVLTFKARSTFVIEGRWALLHALKKRCPFATCISHGNINSRALKRFRKVVQT
mmetsp:Transcript_49320/g.142932  ORF Transcript_49320/g.142932 Transcript_49320/m.142932 type:complete len:332 (+) Transcript_49320:1095-2090(+)